MPILRWDPFRNVATLQGRINRMFEDAFPHNREMDDELSQCAWQPEVDIFESDQGLVIRADLPGVDKSDVSVEIKDNVLNLSGQRPIEKDVSDDQYYRKERCCGSFQRAFNLQRAVDPAKVTAKFKSGVLTIEIPKPEEERPKKILVDID